MADVLSRDGPPFCAHTATISTAASIASLKVAIQSISIYVSVTNIASLGYVMTLINEAGAIENQNEIYPYYYVGLTVDS